MRAEGVGGPGKRLETQMDDVAASSIAIARASWSAHMIQLTHQGHPPAPWSLTMQSSVLRPCATCRVRLSGLVLSLGAAVLRRYMWPTVQRFSDAPPQRLITLLARPRPDM